MKTKALQRESTLLLLFILLTVANTFSTDVLAMSQAVPKKCKYQKTESPFLIESQSGWQIYATGASALGAKWPQISDIVFNLTGTHPRAPRIAILDDGIPLSKREKLKGYIDARSPIHGLLDPASEKTGHGLGVASVMLDRREGILPDGNLLFFGISQETADGVLINGDAGLVASILACKRGHRVINWSYGFANEAFEQMSELQKNTLKTLAENGCMVVKAAGNQNQFLRDSNFSFFNEEALMLVGSTNQYGLISTFSSKGQIYFPGENINLPYQNPMTKRFCGDGKELTNGTSFAAPGVAAMISMLYAILETSTRFETMSGNSQLRLVREIVLSSKSSTTGELIVPRILINGLRALAKLEDKMISEREIKSLCGAKMEPNSSLVGLGSIVFDFYSLCPGVDAKLLKSAARSVYADEIFYRTMLNVGMSSYEISSESKKLSIFSTGELEKAVVQALISLETQDSQGKLETKLLLLRKMRTTYFERNSEKHIFYTQLINQGFFDSAILKAAESEKLISFIDFVNALVIAEKIEPAHLDYVLKKENMSPSEFDDVLRLGFSNYQFDTFGFYKSLIAVRPSDFNPDFFKMRLNVCERKKRLTAEQRQLLEQAWQSH